MKKRDLILFPLFFCLIISSCKDYLSVDKELAEEIEDEDVFVNAPLTRRFHQNIMSKTPDPSEVFWELDGFKSPWQGCSDELKMAQGTLKNLTVTGYTADNAPFHRWTSGYQQIRQANIFLERAQPIPSTGGNADYIDEAELKQMKAQARFYRAYYHYLLFELYGPVPIMDFVEDPTNTDLDYERNSVDEVVDFIYNELTDLINEEGGLNEIETDENYRALPSKGVALAVRAKLMMYAASPLFNGDFQPALQVTNKDGKRLFPDHDESKWQRALDAMKAFIDFAEGHYSLYKEYVDGVYDPDQTLYSMFMSYTDEVIWANSNSSGWGGVASSAPTKAYDRRCTPRSVYNGWACIAITQELVDDFFMNDGLTIDDSPLYSETGFSEEGDNVTGRTEVGTYNMWVNREPRFYQTVMYQGRRWHIIDQVVKFHKGSGNDNSASDYPFSGYLCYKRVPRNTLNTGTYPKTQYRPAFIFRLAEFYLLYAEALNEVNPSDPKIFEFVDRVRERAGIPTLNELQNTGKINIKGNKDLQRKAIQRESRIELCTEGQRYFDVRRWLIAENKPGEGGQGGDFFGMNMNGRENVEEDFFRRTRYETRVFEKEMYLYPIPLSEIQISRKLVQNPGWQGSDISVD